MNINLKIIVNDSFIQVSADNKEEIYNLIAQLNELINEPIINSDIDKVRAVRSYYNSKSTVKVGPIKFDNNEIGYFHIPIGLRKRTLNWAEANEFCKENGFSLPSKEELDLIIEYKDLIDSIDSSTSRFSNIGSRYIWSSSEYGSNYAWIQRPSDRFDGYGTKTNEYWVVPFKRILS